jgi:hypothetical protein
LSQRGDVGSLLPPLTVLVVAASNGYTASTRPFEGAGPRELMNLGEELAAETHSGIAASEHATHILEGAGSAADADPL